MGKSTEIEIGGTKLVVEEHESVSDPATGRAYTGSWIWDASFLLASWMASSSPIFKGKRVVELGAGTGLPGLVAAVLGAQVLLTDIPALVPGLQRNVDNNCLGHMVKVQALQWGDDCSGICEAPVDFILMSDVLYDATAVPDLCSTLRAFTNHTTRILVACELRFGTSECLEIMVSEGFGICEVPRQQLPVDWQGEDYAIFVVSQMNREVLTEGHTGGGSG